MVLNGFYIIGKSCFLRVVNRKIIVLNSFATKQNLKFQTKEKHHRDLSTHSHVVSLNLWLVIGSEFTKFRFPASTLVVHR